MKTLVYLLFCLFLSFVSLGQEITEPKFVAVDNAPEVINDDNQLLIKKYVCDEFQRTSWAQVNRRQGTEVIKFTVDENGHLSNFKVVNSVCCQIDEELVDILKSTDGQWIPAKNAEGEAISKETEVSLVFICEEVADCSKYMMMKARKSFDKANQMMMVKNNPKRALKYYERSVRYCPYETGSLLLRGICRYENNDKEGAVADWERINELGEIDATEYIKKLAQSNSKNFELHPETYAEMVQILK